MWGHFLDLIHKVMNLLFLILFGYKFFLVVSDIGNYLVRAQNFPKK